MAQYLPFFMVFAALWVVQLYGTAKQGQHFMREVGKLRKLGETSIGASSMNRLKRRSYVTLASDETDLVTGAIELAGLTVFSRARPVPELVGQPLSDLATSEADDRRSRAARMAARALLGEELEDTSGSVTSKRAARAARRTKAGPAHRTVQRSASRSSAGHLPSSNRGTDVRDERERGS